MMIAHPRRDLTNEKQEWWKVIAMMKIPTSLGGSSFLSYRIWFNCSKKKCIHFPCRFNVTKTAKTFDLLISNLDESSVLKIQDF